MSDHGLTVTELLDRTIVKSAAGGSLSCYRGPNPEKALAHPAVIDYLLVEYLKCVALEVTPKHMDHPLSIFEPMDKTVARWLLSRLLQDPDTVHIALMFQNIIAASNASITFPFASDDTGDERIVNPRVLQHYNRVFIVKRGSRPDSVNMRNVGAWVINKTSAEKRAATPGALPRVVDPMAADLLHQLGFTLRQGDMGEGYTFIEPTHDVVIRKITGMDPTWPVVIVNDDLHCMSEEKRQALLSCLDLDTYVNMAAASFDKNWMNHAPAESLALVDGEAVSQSGDDTEDEEAVDDDL